jgi:hypothetical protein
MRKQAITWRRARRRPVLLWGAVVATAVLAFGCGTQANGPTTVPQGPPAPLEPAITGHFVDEDSGRSAVAADAGTGVDAQAVVDAASAAPRSDGSVLLVSDASAP